MRRFKSAWIRQLPAQVERLGREKAPYYVEWKEPDGRKRTESCGPGQKGRRLAERRRDELKAQLITETYESAKRRVTWEEFRAEYETKGLSHVQPSSRKEMVLSLRCFTRVAKPRLLESITTQSIEEFKTKRQEERGRKPGSRVSRATVNKDLRNVRGALRTAVDWGYLKKAPKIKFLREPRKLPRYVEPEHFGEMYAACHVAYLPNDVQCPASDWWRALLVMAQMTGWRIGEMLSLRWQDVDLDAGFAITRHHDNKGHRDEKVPLHPVVVDHLRSIRAFDDLVFRWSPNRRTLDAQFARIQDAAGINLPCPEAGKQEHGQCTPACRRYSFHDERRAFATLNADKLPLMAMKVLMRHQSSSTTEKYINIGRQLNPALANLHVPQCLTDTGT